MTRPLVLFAPATSHRSGSSLAVYAALVRQGVNADLHWLGQQAGGTVWRKARPLLERAALLVDDGELDRPDLPPTLQLHHGTPWKTMGFDHPGGCDPSKTRRRQTIGSAAGGPYAADLWSRLMRYDNAEILQGTPRADVLVNSRRPRNPEIRTLLWAPTWRDYETFPTQATVEQVARALPEGWRLMVRTHPRVVLRTRWSVRRGESVEDSLFAADVLMTDYSSILFDWLLLDRPLILWQPDADTYMRERGTNFPLTPVPGVVIENIGALSEVLDTDPAAEARGVWRERTCSWEDGAATQRAVDFVRKVIERA